jgi:hypothetical protein
VDKEDLDIWTGPMDAEWQKTFRQRIRRFESSRSVRRGEPALSIKVRVVSGCFHREHSPRAYILIDHYLEHFPPLDHDFALEEHESGPELLVYLTLAAGGLSLAKSIIDLVTAIIEARSKGVGHGDRPAEPVELIVRRIDEVAGFKEELVLRFGHQDPVDPKLIQQRLNEAIHHVIDLEDNDTSQRIG